MGWFNYYGLIVIILIMIPNMVFAAIFAPTHILISIKNAVL